MQLFVLSYGSGVYNTIPHIRRQQPAELTAYSVNKNLRWPTADVLDFLFGQHTHENIFLRKSYVVTSKYMCTLLALGTLIRSHPGLSPPN